MLRTWLILFVTLLLLPTVLSIGGPTCLSFTETEYAITSGRLSASIWIDSSDWPGVHRAALDLQNDLEKVTGIRPSVQNLTLPSINATPDDFPAAADAVTSTIPIIIGTLGKSNLLNLAKQTNPTLQSKFATIEGKWEAGISEVIKNFLPGMNAAYTIIGSDKRGTIFGIYDFLEQAGVSPW